MAEGYTSSEIEILEGDATTWNDGHKGKAASAPRIHIRIRRNLVPLSKLEENGLDYLIGRQNTFSWLSEEETFALEAVCD